jgi:hypothetical protein
MFPKLNGTPSPVSSIYIDARFVLDVDRAIRLRQGFGGLFSINIDKVNKKTAFAAM